MKWTTIRDRILTGLGLATAALIVASSFSGAPETTDGAAAPSTQVAAAPAPAHFEGKRND